MRKDLTSKQLTVLDKVEVPRKLLNITSMYENPHNCMSHIETYLSCSIGDSHNSHKDYKLVKFLPISICLPLGVSNLEENVLVSVRLIYEQDS